MSAVLNKQLQHLVAMFKHMASLSSESRPLYASCSRDDRPRLSISIRVFRMAFLVLSWVMEVAMRGDAKAALGDEDLVSTLNT
jgi:hypothetical protein